MKKDKINKTRKKVIEIKSSNKINQPIKNKK